MGNEFQGSYSELVGGMLKYINFSFRQVQLIKDKFELMADEDLTIDKKKFMVIMNVNEKDAEKIFEYFDLD